MGNGMTKVLPGLYLGNFIDAKDPDQLSRNNITHIISIHESPQPLMQGITYLRIPVADNPDVPIKKHFKECINFIHCCRLNGGNCLVHCFAGISRSTTVVTAYVMTVTGLGWREVLDAIKSTRPIANPNPGFRQQLEEFGWGSSRKELMEKISSASQAAGGAFRREPVPRRGGDALAAAAVQALPAGLRDLGRLPRAAGLGLRGGPAAPGAAAAAGGARAAAAAGARQADFLLPPALPGPPRRQVRAPALFLLTGPQRGSAWASRGLQEGPEPVGAPRRPGPCSCPLCLPCLSAVARPPPSRLLCVGPACCSHLVP
ncbi:dual specificity protein phosphatase 15 isoform X1 [Pipistrellus kuhlii]|uniref:Dual specificity protein phosphatase 15 n=1 Tax=Pipistrellus kuhlii TaxID=59472 RepID=A0A7J7Y8M4_PIPKU|nr:dual specificity protein phosphatase 15 isoform X1 [Pipistrellus kuhlii]KAF6358168.1 dual specificity phosphatase 15 [Pipistrellus kuhlii]